ncbi:MAG TPA: VOC family protein [Acidobacteriaceae bacterium]|nr:VOC family protein [Acidobacteriaceae bacterium]
MKISILFASATLAFVSWLPTYAQTATARPPITGVSHLSVYTTNSAKAEYFYVHDLGAAKKADPENPLGVRYYFSPVQFIEVLPLPAGNTSINRLDHTAYNTTNAEELRQYLATHGIKVPARVESGSDGSHWFDVYDPEGNKIQFVQPPARPISLAGANPISNHIIHVGYLVHSRSAEDKFYRVVLGFRPYWYGGEKPGTTDWVSQQVPNGTDWLEYMLIDSPDTKGIPADMTASDLGVLDHFSLGVKNIENSVNILWSGNRLGSKYDGPQMGMDGKWQFNMFDPDGTRVEIMEFQPTVKPCCSAFTAASPKK